MTLKELLVGFGTQVRSIWMIGLHAFAKRETRMYPEELGLSAAPLSWSYRSDPRPGRRRALRSL